MLRINTNSWILLTFEASWQGRLCVESWPFVGIWHLRQHMQQGIPPQQLCWALGLVATRVVLGTQHSWPYFSVRRNSLDLTPGSGIQCQVLGHSWAKKKKKIPKITITTNLVSGALPTAYRPDPISRLSLPSAVCLLTLERQRTSFHYFLFYYRLNQLKEKVLTK